MLINHYVMTEKCAGKLKTIIFAIPLNVIALEDIKMCKERKIT